MTEINEQEIRDTIFEVLKKQIAEDKIAKEQRREKGRITTSDLTKKNSFCTNDVLSETEELLSKRRDINNLTERVWNSFCQLRSERYFDLGAYQHDLHPLKFFLTDKGRKITNSLSS